MFYLYPAMRRITRRHLLGDHPIACRHNMDHSSRLLVFIPEGDTHGELILKHPGVAALYIRSIPFGDD